MCFVGEFCGNTMILEQRQNAQGAKMEGREEQSEGRFPSTIASYKGWRRKQRNQKKWHRESDKIECAITNHSNLQWKNFGKADGRFLITMAKRFRALEEATGGDLNQFRLDRKQEAQKTLDHFSFSTVE